MLRSVLAAQAPPRSATKTRHPRWAPVREGRSARAAWPCALLLALLAVSSTGCGRDTIDLRGSGASFPEIVYRNWIVEYCRAHEDVRITYAAKGSGPGIADITAGLVDFAGSDAAMTDEELTRARAANDGRAIRMLPMTAGGIVVAYNLEGHDDLRLSRDALVGIFLGEIDRWNDERIARANPDAALPDREIHVVVRSDGSGTTYAFTGHLAAVSDAFRERIGRSKSPNWPVGSGAAKNAGVAASIKSNPGTIGYVEYSFAKELQQARLENAAGRFVAPTLDNMATALASAELPPNLRGFVDDPVGQDAYPIVTLTWLLVFESYPERELGVLKDFLRWCLSDGQERAAPAGYVPLPHRIVDRVRAAVDSLEPLPPGGAAPR
jgi:phosphate transport system substrate-binding protein